MRGSYDLQPKEDQATPEEQSSPIVEFSLASKAWNLKEHPHVLATLARLKQSSAPHEQTVVAWARESQEWGGDLITGWWAQRPHWTLIDAVKSKALGLQERLRLGQELLDYSLAVKRCIDPSTPRKFAVDLNGRLLISLAEMETRANNRLSINEIRMDWLDPLGRDLESYGVAALLYEVLSGECRPSVVDFRRSPAGTTLEETELMRAAFAYKPLDALSGELNEVLNRALGLDEKRRFASLEKLRDAYFEASETMILEAGASEAVLSQVLDLGPTVVPCRNRHAAEMEAPTLASTYWNSRAYPQAARLLERLIQCPDPFEQPPLTWKVECDAAGHEGVRAWYIERPSTSVLAAVAEGTFGLAERLLLAQDVLTYCVNNIGALCPLNPQKFAVSPQGRLIIPLQHTLNFHGRAMVPHDSYHIQADWIDPVGSPADLYAYAVMSFVYQILDGKAPLGDDHRKLLCEVKDSDWRADPEILAQLRAQPIPGISPLLNDVLERAVSVELKRRFSSLRHARLAFFRASRTE